MFLPQDDINVTVHDALVGMPLTDLKRTLDLLEGSQTVTPGISHASSLSEGRSEDLNYEPSSSSLSACSGPVDQPPEPVQPVGRITRLRLRTVPGLTLHVPAPTDLQPGAPAPPVPAVVTTSQTVVQAHENINEDEEVGAVGMFEASDVARTEDE